jgi:uncharacterized damage-inducible protein DinB
MITSIKDFAAEWRTCSEDTGKIFAALTQESLSQAVVDDHRNIGRIAWHIVLTIPEMCGRTGLKVEGPAETDPVPATVEEIRDAYETVSKSLAEQIAKHWNDTTLQKEDDMYGETWKRGMTLTILMNHEIHHRGQITVLMRQAGLKVPGVFGPSKEEWSQYGMAVPEV